MNIKKWLLIIVAVVAIGFLVLNLYYFKSGSVFERTTHSYISHKKTRNLDSLIELATIDSMELEKIHYPLFQNKWKIKFSVARLNGYVKFNDLFHSPVDFIQIRDYTEIAGEYNHLNDYNVNFGNFVVAEACDRGGEQYHSILVKKNFFNKQIVSFITKPGRMPPPRAKLIACNDSSQISFAEQHKLNKLKFKFMEDSTLRVFVEVPDNSKFDTLTYSYDTLDGLVSCNVKINIVEAAQNIKNSAYIEIPKFDKSKFIVIMFWKNNLVINKDCCYLKHAAFKFE